MALLIDISNVPECCSDHALEHLYKALSDDNGLAHDIWAQHENPFIRALVEKFTERGLFKIQKVHDELTLWMAGKYHVPHKVSAGIPAGYMGRWTPQELELVRLYLENIPPTALSLDDWSMLVDYMVQRYLPHDQLNEEAEWLAVKSNMMGKVQAHLTEIDAATAAAVVDAMPSTVFEAATMFKLSDADEAILNFGKLSACENVQAVSEGFRHKLKTTILDHQAQAIAGDPSANPQTLEQKLFDAFDSANRDWRKIAITEAGNMSLTGVIASLQPGTMVKRIEQYHGACPFCKKIHGRMLKVVDPAKPDKDYDTEVWVGKTNIGRSASPKKRVGNTLVPRTPEEMWTVPAGLAHPFCRGNWFVMDGAPSTGNDEFDSFLANLLNGTPNGSL
jgi:hypothetical protein